jgi:hypothetical protein
MHGTTLPVALSPNLAPGSSGGANLASGASILFSTNAGSILLSFRIFGSLRQVRKMQRRA